MSGDNEVREHVARALSSMGAVCPARYATMLSQTPKNRVIESLSPWAFLPDPERSAKYCTEAVSRLVLPFAQAVGQEMVACFLPKPLANPGVVVINPWSEDKAAVIKAELTDYDAWLDYAAEISRQVQAREAEEDEDG